MPPRATILILVLSTTVWVTDLSICVRHEREDNHDDYDDAVEILSVLCDRLGLKRIAVLSARFTPRLRGRRQLPLASGGLRGATARNDSGQSQLGVLLPEWTR